MTQPLFKAAYHSFQQTQQFRALKAPGLRSKTESDDGKRDAIPIKTLE